MRGIRCNNMWGEMKIQFAIYGFRSDENGQCKKCIKEQTIYIVLHKCLPQPHYAD
jgi:hypothetical protein